MIKTPSWNFLPESEGDIRSINQFYDAFSLAQSFADELVTKHLPEEIAHVDGSLFTGHICSYVFDEIELKVQLDFTYMFPMFHHEIANKTLSRKKVDALRTAAREWVPGQKDEMLHISGTLPPSLNDIALLILRLIEFVTSHIREYREEERSADPNTSQGWDVREAASLSLADVVRNQHGVDLSTVQDITAHIIGQTIGEIRAGIQELLSSFRVVHFEPVLRADLAAAFLRRQASLRSDLEQHASLRSLRQHVSIRAVKRNDRALLIDELLRPRLTFHGTRASVVRDIVRFGFLKPGDVHPLTGTPLPLRCGSTFGRGIYSSPSAHFALHYAGWDGAESSPAALPGLKLLVCATLMGRSAQMRWEDDWREQTRPYPGADSHVANFGDEYVVFDAAQILPCYVLHVDWTDARPEDVMGRLRAQVRRRGQQRRRQQQHEGEEEEEEGGFQSVVYPGDRQRAKQERMARARKFFAYGFGPVPGDKVVIEDIAEADDDEEDYGEYQQERLLGEVERTSVWEWEEGVKLEGETQFDEYADARRAWRKVGRGDRRGD